MTPGDLKPPSDLESRLRFETSIADLSSRFINVPVEEVDGEIEAAQRRVCGDLDLDLSALWLWSSDGLSEPTRPHLYRRIGGLPVPERMDARQSFPWSLDQVRAGRLVSLTRVGEAPPEAARDKETWHDLGLKSVLTLPLSAIGSPVNGALTFASMREERDWPDHLVTRLRLVARIFADALARKHVNAALRESEARLNLATVSAGVGIWSVDFESLRVWVSPLMREQLQFDPAREITYQSLLDAVHPADRETVDQAVRHASQTDALLFVEYRIVQPDGTLRWIAARGRRSGSSGGEPDRLLGVSVDVTDLKQRERELKEANEFSRDILSSLADGVAIVDREGRILAVNDEWERVAAANAGLEILAGAGVGTSYLEMCRRAGAHDVLDGIERVLNGQSGFVTIEYCRPGSAGTRWFQVRAMPLKRRTSGTLIAHTDVTERKKSEAELEKQREQVLHANRVAQTSVLTASLAHELNQPLAAILTNAQAGLRLIDRDNPDVEELREILRDIVSDDKRAAAVIGGLRAIPRRGGSERTRIGLADTIQDVLRLLHSEMLGQGVQLRAHSEFDGTVLADRTQIQLVVLNLVMNAVEAMRSVPVSRRSLDVTVTRSGPGEVLVTVRDSGPGIPEDQRGKIFEAVWTTKPQGIGVGLRISRSIVESHGGRLWFTDNPNHGATFCFALPLANGPSSAAK